jgi:hypothetical protein
MTERQTVKQTGEQRNRLMDRQTDRWAGGRTDRWTDGQIDRRTDGQANEKNWKLCCFRFNLFEFDRLDKSDVILKMLLKGRPIDEIPFVGKQRELSQ